MTDTSKTQGPGKWPSFHLNLTVLLAVIFSGMALLAFLLARVLTERYLGGGPDMVWALRFWAVMVWLVSFGLAFGISRMVLRPVERFVREAEKFTARQKSTAKGPLPRSDDLTRMGRIFEEVTDRLSQVEAREQFPEMVGESRVMRGVFSQILKIAPTESTVLVQGESGTGKELVAGSLHRHSRRRQGPLVKVNCAAIPETLVESELFGHEKGAFTGASSTKKGKFELAHTGTIFLDEIGDMPLETQAKLLRVLQEKEIERLGGSRPIPVDVRVVAASNQPLAELVAKGKFREDLLYRLNVLSIHLPPLRERIEDLPVLVDFFLKGRDVSVSGEARQVLMAHTWPGNVRELQSEVERAAVRAGDGAIGPEHLSASVRHLDVQEKTFLDPRKDQTLDERLAALEQAMIIEALKKTGGVQARAAELLGIKPRSLWHRVKKYDIPVESIRENEEG